MVNPLMVPARYNFLYILVRHEAPFDRVGWKAHLWAVAAAR
jgi:hypothetical protein